MTNYTEGTVAIATVRGVPNVRVFLTAVSSQPEYTVWRHVEIEGCYYSNPHDVTDIRPLVVLDLDSHKKSSRLYDLPAFLRGLVQADKREFGLGGPQRDFALWLADQIEEQTKPARIPQPGRYGVVRAVGLNGLTREFVRTLNGWSDGYTVIRWDDLKDPVLVREGVDV